MSLSFMQAGALMPRKECLVELLLIHCSPPTNKPRLSNCARFRCCPLRSCTSYVAYCPTARSGL